MDKNKQNFYINLLDFIQFYYNQKNYLSSGKQNILYGNATSDIQSLRIGVPRAVHIIPYRNREYNMSVCCARVKI